MCLQVLLLLAPLLVVVLVWELLVELALWLLLAQDLRLLKLLRREMALLDFLWALRYHWSAELVSMLELGL